MTSFDRPLVYLVGFGSLPNGQAMALNSLRGNPPLLELDEDLTPPNNNLGNPWSIDLFSQTHEINQQQAIDDLPALAADLMRVQYFNNIYRNHKSRSTY